MKFFKLNIPTKVLFLLSLICFTSFIETKNNIDLSLRSLNRHTLKAFSSNKKSTNISKSELKSKSSLTSLSKRLKYSSAKATTKKYQKSQVSKRKSSSSFKRMMRYRTQWQFFDKLSGFFHGLKEKFTGSDNDQEPVTSNISLYDKTKLQAENFLLKTIWEQTLSKVTEFEKIVEQVSFTANNPITALLFNIQDIVFKQDPNLKYSEGEKREIPLDKEEKVEKTDEDKKKEQEEKSKFQKLVDSARVKSVELIENTVTNVIEDTVKNQFDAVYTGFFKTMLIEFSPIAMINIQDSVTIGHIQDTVTGAVGQNEVSKSEEQLTSTVNDFINSTVEGCKNHSNLKDVSKNFIQRTVKFMSRNFAWFKKMIKGLNDLIKRAKGIKVEEDKPKGILKSTGEKSGENAKKGVRVNEALNEVHVFDAEEDVTIWSQIRSTAYAIWSLIKDEIFMFFSAMKQCLNIYNENFVKFLPRARITFAVSIIGGIIDGFVKHIPGVSQLIGLVNSIIGIYTSWRIFTFGDIDLSIKDGRKVDNSLLGVKLARFLASTIRGALGLLNIPGIENLMKVAYHVYLIMIDSWKMAMVDSGSTFTKVGNFILNLTGITISRETFDSFWISLKKFFFGKKKLRKHYKK